MRRTALIGTFAVALAMGGAGLLATSARGSTAVVTGDLRGTVTSVSSTSVVLAVTEASSGLRLLKARSLKLKIVGKTQVQRNGRTSKLSALKPNDVVNARAKCSFAITNTASKITCQALRVFATAPVAPTAVEFTITGTTTVIDRSSFMLMATQVAADANASTVVGSFDIRQPVSLAYDSRTVVLLDGATANFSSVSSSNPIQVSVTCQPVKPYNCRAWKILILLPEPMPVTLVGLVTLITPNSITLDIESVVHSLDAGVNVQLLRRQQLPVAVPSGISVFRGTNAVALQSLSLGERLTVRATCRLVVPFDCTASQVSARG